MQGLWLKSHAKLQPWYLIEGLRVVLLSGNPSDVTTISQDAEDLFCKAYSTMESTNQPPPYYKKTLPLWGDGTVWTGKENALPIEHWCLSSSINMLIMGH